MSGTVWVYLLIVVAAALSFLLSTVGFAARDLSRARLEAVLERRKRDDLLDPIYDARDDLAFLAAAGRLIANLVLLMGILHLVRGWVDGEWTQYGVSLFITGMIALVLSVLLPHTLAEHAGEFLLGSLGRTMLALRTALRPLAGLKNITSNAFERLAGGGSVDEDGEDDDEYEAELLSAVEEGEKEGSIDPREREMIERAIVFSNREVSEAMTARPDVVALSKDATLEEIREKVIESGHSRIPVYDGDLDHVIGILYARDLIGRVAKSGEDFQITEATRKPLFVFEHKPLRDLLQDFRLKKIHMAIVQDEYGATAGVCTIEDVLEELVGEISDEHEPLEPAMFRRLSDDEADCDARLHVDDLNRMFGTELSEEEEYDTLGGFVMTHLGRIPQAGTTFDYENTRYTVLDAEPHRVNRIRVRHLRAAEDAAAMES